MRITKIDEVQQLRYAIEMALGYMPTNIVIESETLVDEGYFELGKTNQEPPFKNLNINGVRVCRRVTEDNTKLKEESFLKRVVEVVDSEVIKQLEISEKSYEEAIKNFSDERLNYLFDVAPTNIRAMVVDEIERRLKIKPLSQEEVKERGFDSFVESFEKYLKHRETEEDRIKFSTLLYGGIEFPTRLIWSLPNEPMI